MIRRLKKDVLTQLPPKQRQKIPFKLKESDIKKVFSVFRLGEINVILCFLFSPLKLFMFKFLCHTGFVLWFAYICSHCWFLILPRMLHHKDLDKTWDELETSLGRNRKSLAQVLTSKCAVVGEMSLAGMAAAAAGSVQNTTGVAASSIQIYRLLTELYTKTCTAKVVVLDHFFSLSVAYWMELDY